MLKSIGTLQASTRCTGLSAGSLGLSMFARESEVRQALDLFEDNRRPCCCPESGCRALGRWWARIIAEGDRRRTWSFSAYCRYRRIEGFEHFDSRPRWNALVGFVSQLGGSTGLVELIKVMGGLNGLASIIKKLGGSGGLTSWINDITDDAALSTLIKGANSPAGIKVLHNLVK